MITFGDKMKALRKNNEWSQKFTAEKMDVSPQMYNNYEKNKTKPSIEILKRICTLYNTNLDSLDCEYDSVSDFVTSVRIENSFDRKARHYQVIETVNMSAEQLQEYLNNATSEVPEKLIDHVVGTKIILSFIPYE